MDQKCPNCKEGVLGMGGRQVVITDHFKAIVDQVLCSECGWETTVSIGHPKGDPASWEKTVADVLSRCWNCGSPLPLKSENLGRNWACYSGKVTTGDWSH